MSINLNDKELIKLCLSKEKYAIKELYMRYGGYLLTVCIRYMGNRQEAEDLLQDSFLKILNSLDKFTWKGGGSLKAWLTKCVCNECLQQIRKKKLVITNKDINEYIDIVYEPNVEDIIQIPYSTLLQYIAELPDGYRNIFNMFVFEKMTHREISKKLNIKEKTSSSQFYRARQLLAEKIKKYMNRQF